MPGMRRREVVTAIGLGAAGVFAGSARADADWPNRPVRVIIPYAPGAGTDFIIRGVCERLSRQLGQQFVVEHKPGAAGTLGAETVVKSPPDGYTLLMTPQAPVQLMPHLRPLPYNAMTDLVPVARMGESISGFAVHPSLAVKDVPTFVALAKKYPGKYTYATAGVGSVNHLRGETLKLMAGIDLLHVPYKGVGEALPDLLSGVVSSMFDSNVFPHAKSGKLTLLAILADERYSEFPDVKTLKEQGFPDYDVPVWFGAYAPAGVSRVILEKLNTAISAIHSDDEFRAKQFAGGILIYREGMGLEQVRRKVVEQSEYFGDLIRRAKIRLEV